MIDKLYSLELFYNDQPASFVVKTMEEIHRRQGGIADPPHRHNYYSVIWSVAATGRHIIDFKEYAIKPDLLFFVSPHQMHQVITDPTPEPKGYVILFTPEFLFKNSISESFISNLMLFRDWEETPPLPVTSENRLRLDLFVQQMIQAFSSSIDLRMEIIGAYLKLFLIECRNNYSPISTDNPQIIEVGRSITQRFKMLVEENFRKWHQVRQYADSLNITPNYLNEVIKTSVKRSAKEYIQHRLILEAKRQYLFANKSVKEIGFDLGFEDPSHFSKFFKSYTKLSLQQFKESVYRN